MRLFVPSLAVVVLLAGVTVAQDPPPPPAPAAAPTVPIERFRTVQDQINEGQFELAAESLTGFLALAPSAQDYLDIEAKYGVTTFLRLSNIPRWYDDPKKDAEFLKNTLEKVIAASIAANKELTRGRKRIERFVKNLRESKEERDFAVAELRRGGDAVVPVLIESLRLDRVPEQEAGIMQAVRELGPDIVPGVLAAAAGLPDELKAPLLKALTTRPDVPTLVGNMDTDFTALLWYLSSGPTAIAPVAAQQLSQLTGGASERRDAATELVALAAPALQRKARFANVVTDPKTNAKVVKVWTWDAATQTLAGKDVSKSEAEELYGLRTLRWAVERKPGFQPAEEAFVALAVERAVERANFVDLAKADPGVYRLLAGAPAQLLTGLLETALAENKTALAYGVITALGDRAEKVAAMPPSKNTPAPLVRALAYPDPRVQFAAAVALLRIPSDGHGVNGRIVEILKRTVANDPAGDKAAARAVIVDPSPPRSDMTANLFRTIGYQTEQLGTGRDLLRRVQRASNFDIVVLDRHVADPTLNDVLAQLRADANFGRRPVVLVASADQQRPVGFETILLRLALLIAATETEDTTLPAILPVDPRKTNEERIEERREASKVRDAIIGNIYAARLARLKRLVSATNAVATPALRDRLELRLPQLTYAAIIAEFDTTPNTSPATFEKFDLLTRRLAADPDTAALFDGVSTETLGRLTLELEGALTPPLREKFETLRKRIDAAAFGLQPERLRDPVAEASLVRTARHYSGVTVIPEPFAKGTLEDDLKVVFQDDPTKSPRSADEKAASSATAVMWLRKLATGERPGFDVRPAEATLRQAMTVDAFAPDAIDAVARIASTEAQQDLVKVVLATNRPLPIRLRAAAAAAMHIQANGRLISPEQAGVLANSVDAEKDNEVRSRLALLRSLTSGSPADLGKLIQSYRPATQTAPEKAAEPKMAPSAGAGSESK